jgi:hypothetical protein
MASPQSPILVRGTLSADHLAAVRDGNPLVKAARAMRRSVALDRASRPPITPISPTRTAHEQGAEVGWSGTPEEARAALDAVRAARGGVL